MIIGFNDDVPFLNLPWEFNTRSHREHRKSFSRKKRESNCILHGRFRGYGPDGMICILRGRQRHGLLLKFWGGKFCCVYLLHAYENGRENPLGGRGEGGGGEREVWTLDSLVFSSLRAQDWKEFIFFFDCMKNGFSGFSHAHSKIQRDIKKPENFFFHNSCKYLQSGLIHR